MKKTIAGILLLCMLLTALAACGGKGTASDQDKDPDQNNGTVENGGEDEKDPPEDGSEDGSGEDSLPSDSDVTPITLNIGSYNIANGRVVDHNMMKLAKDITSKKLDIVGLQEVDQLCTRSGNIDTMKLLSELTGYKYYCFYKAINLSGTGPDGKGEYGSAILSKYPIVETERLPLDSEGKEARVLGRAAIDVNGQTIQFFVTHLSYEATGIRARQFLYVNDVISQYDNVILTGDFNISSLSEYRVLDNVSAVNTEEHFVYTFPSSKSCIDNIIYSQDAFTFGEPNMLANGNSDHNMIYATCQMRPSSLASDCATLTGAQGVDCDKLVDGMVGTSSDIGTWKEGTAGGYIEIDLQAEYNLNTVRVINGITSSAVYKWAAYGSADNTLGMESWIKIAEKSGEETCDKAGYTVTLSEEMKALNLRYIRIYGTYNSESEQYPIAEIALFGKIAEAKKTDMSAKVEITDASGNKLTALQDRLVNETTDIGNWAEGTDGCYIDIDLGEPSLLYALNLTNPVGKNYKWTAYAALDKDAPISEWTVIAAKTDYSVTTDAGYTVYLAGDVKDNPYRYIRIYGTGNDGGESYEVSEVYVYGFKVSDLDNLLFDATVINGNGDPYTILTDGSVEEYEDLGYWADKVTGPAYGTAGTCYVEIDLGKVCYIEQLKVVNLVSSSRVYKWDAYVTDDNGKPIADWVKIGGKTDNGKSTSDGYTLTLPEEMQKTAIRYIRIYGTYHSANCGYHIAEISVVGTQA